MKKLLFILLFAIPNAMAQMQLMKPIICDKAELILGALIEQGQELPTWIGRGDGEDNSQTTILVNEKTKTWTIIQFEKDRACVLGSGVSSKEIFYGPKV
jgi:hypothetical protein